MVNFIGGLPLTNDLLTIPNAHLHLYDKEPRKGRKVAHASVRAKTTEELESLIKKLTTLANQVDNS